MGILKGKRRAWGGLFAAISYCVFVFGDESKCTSAYDKLADTSRLAIVFSNGAPQGSKFGVQTLDIRDRHTNERLGGINLSIDKNGVAHILSISVVKDRRGEGIGPEAQAAVLKYLFDSWQVREVQATIAHTNIRSIKAHQKIGFSRLAPNDPNSETYHVTAQDLKKALAQEKGTTSTLRELELVH